MKIIYTYKPTHPQKAPCESTSATIPFLFFVENNVNFLTSFMSMRMCVWKDGERIKVVVKEILVHQKIVALPSYLHMHWR